ncbi:MAG: DUF6036 family nucleotidyltransferase [Acidobacteriota bacterium]
MELTKKNIKKYFSKLSDQLKLQNSKGEILLFGGAAMILTFNSRISTKDVDAVFKPKKEFQIAIDHVAKDNNLNKNWLNDAVKGFLYSNKFNQKEILKFDNLTVYVPEPEYLLAMKVISMRTEAVSSDFEDIKTLLKETGLDTPGKVLDLVREYYPENMIPQKSFYALEGIISEAFNNN